MTRRLAPSALVLLALLFGLAGAAGAAHLLLLVAVMAAAVAVLDTVSQRVARRAGMSDLGLAVAGLAFVVAAAAARAPLVAVPAVLVFGLEPWLDAVRPARPERRQSAARTS